MEAQEIMTRDVVTVGADTTVGEIAALLVHHRISAVPVVSGDRHLIGIVTQTDLVHRSETGTEKRRKWWLEIFADPDVRAREYVKSHGRKARDIMTRVVVSVPPNASLGEVADVLDSQRIRQVPVVSKGTIVGMISRADIVRKLAETKAVVSDAGSDNGALQEAIWEQIRAQPWLKAALVNLTVRDGVVELYGAVDSSEQRQALRVLVEGVPGVRKVEDHVGLLPSATGV